MNILAICFYFARRLLFYGYELAAEAVSCVCFASVKIARRFH